MRKLIIILIVVVIALLGQVLYSELSSNLISNQTFSYNNTTNVFSGEVDFEVKGFKKATDVEVMVINPDNTVTFLDLKKNGKQYTSEKYEFNVSEETLKERRPEFLVSWRIDGRKNIEYVYKGKDKPFFPEEPE